MRKNRFFTFVLSFMPGLGQMYLGLMKKGTSIMTIFLGIVFVAGFFNMPLICFILPVIWFYSFFDAINYNNMPIEQKILIEDKVFLLDEIFGENGYLKKYNFLVGGVCIFLGIYILYDRFVLRYLWNSHIFRAVPTLALSVFIILLGISLIKNNQKNIEDLREKKYTEFDENQNNK